MTGNGAVLDFCGSFPDKRWHRRFNRGTVRGHARAASGVCQRHLAEAQKKIERYRVERELAEAEAQQNTADTMQ